MRMPELTLPPPSPQALLREGAVLGVWRLRAALHGRDALQGSSAGQWYSARHAMAADRNCNVLVLPRCERSAGIMLRFGDQVGDLGALAHPAIKVPNDSGVTPGGQPYLIFDSSDGQPIVRACSTLPLRDRLRLVVQLCEALRYTHQQGWLLGEFDPALLWVNAERQLTLMGMGLLRIPDPADPFERGLSLASAPGFASPEALAGEPPSFASEVYGLGVLLCLLVDGRLPNQLDGSNDGHSPAASWPGLTALERFSLDALCAKAIAPQAARRYAGAEALAEDLRCWLAGEDHSALVLTPMPLLSKASAETDAMTYESSVPAWPPRPSAGRRALWAGLALSTLAALSVGAWLAPQFWPQIWPQGLAASNLGQQPSGAGVAAKLAAPMRKPELLAANALDTPPAQAEIAPEPAPAAQVEAKPAFKPLVQRSPTPAQADAAVAGAPAASAAGLATTGDAGNSGSSGSSGRTGE